MQCPNCGDQQYQLGSQCGACSWKPVADKAVFQQEREQRAQEDKEEYRTNVGVACIILVFFIFIFWMFPSGRRATDWFELTFWEILWALLLSAVAFTMAFKK